MSKIRRTVWFSGVVQGVGFRYTTRAVAAQFDVQGFVRNVADGRVQIVVEGETPEVARFQEAVAAAMRPQIDSIESDESTATGEFQGFSIRR